MSIGIKTPGLHHIVLRSTDIARSREFYTGLLGFPVVFDSPELFLFAAGTSVVGVRGPVQQSTAGDSFSPFRVGLDHMALACEDESELERVAKALNEAGVENTGVKMDDVLGKRYVAFKDPDRISWEYYMA